MPESESPVAAQYVVTFLKPEMLHVYRQITALRGWRPVVLCQKREHAKTFPFREVVLLPKPRTHALRRVWQKQILGRPITIYRSEARQLRDELRRMKARVLHVYFGHIGVHLLPFLEIAELPVIVSFHGADVQVEAAHLPLTRRMFQLATLVLARSESLADRLIALGGPAEKIRVHRTGVPLTEIAPRVREAPGDGAWRCVQACRLIPKKGLVTALTAFAIFAREHPRATFTIAGEGPQLAELRALTGALPIAERVFFTGFLSQEKLRALYAESHLFLHPSETGPEGDQEGVPNAMLEAMASGLPVVATRHGGIPEAVEEGVSGFLAEEGDVPGLAGALLKITLSPQGYAAMSAAAAERVAAQFDLEVQSRRLAAIYDEAGEIRSRQLSK